ncbi:MAG: T9SS type A sorting domain-containing protein [Bacteroidota bacterium]
MHSLLRFTAFALVLALAPSAFAQDLAPRVYPNPVDDERAVTVEVSDAEAATLEIIDILGRRVSVDAPLATGTYFVRVRYADGRALEPTALTVASPGTIELRLVEALAQAAESKAAPVLSAPVATQSHQGDSCPDGDELFGGFEHTEFTGSLRLRTDLIPKSMRAQPAPGTNTVDFSTCFGATQGVAYRFVSGTDIGNRPLRVLSPASVGNTQASFTARYSADFNPATALYGTFEVFLDDDGDAQTPDVPAVQVGFDADFIDVAKEQRPANRGGAGYQLLVFDANENLVFETFASENTPLFVTPTGDATRVNLLRSTILSSVVDGFEVPGAGTPPGDLKVSMTFESGDGGDVNVHVDTGAPDAVGATVHIVPTVFFSDPGTFSVFDIRTFATGVNRYGLRAIQFAGGGGDQGIPTTKGPGFVSDAQWGRPQGDYTDPNTFDVFDAQPPFMLVGADGPAEEYGVQFGREPRGLTETGSDAILLLHGGFLTRGFAGIPLADDGDFYRGTARIRNETDTQADLMSTTFSNVGGSTTSILVESGSAAFTTFEFAYDADADGTAEIRQDGTVGVPLSFNVSDVQIQGSAAGDGDPDAIGSRQDFAQAFLVVRNDNAGVVYIFPDWPSPDADVDVRSYAAEADEAFFISGVLETDQDDVDALRTLLLRGLTAAE